MSTQARQAHQARLRTDRRERLLEAVVTLVARDGYLRTPVGEIAGRAEISRASFYELFASKEDCFLAACREQSGVLLGEVADAVAQQPPEQAAESALGALTRYANRRPEAIASLAHGAMLAGPPGWREHDRLMDGLVGIVERAWSEAPPGASLVDVPARMLLEGATRFLRLRLRREGRISDGVLAGMHSWVDAYRIPTPPARWRSREPDQTLRETDGTGSSREALPPPMPRGRSAAGSEVVRSLQQERIVYATADAIRAKGFTDTTVADIVAISGLSRDVFYAHFHDKEEALEETIGLAFERLMASLAAAFFNRPGDWREQIWAAADAFCAFLEVNPTLAHIIFVGTNPPLPLMNRVDDLVRAFTIFIDGGYQHRRESDGVPRLVAQALLCAVLERVSFHVRHDRVPDLRGLLHVSVYMVLAPFLGTEEASRFVERKRLEAAAGAVAPGGWRAGESARRPRHSHATELCRAEASSTRPRSARAG